jgi:hypothetical protein
LSAALLLLTQPVLSPALLKNLADLIQNTPEDCKLDVAQKILLQPNISFEILETVLNWCKNTINNILKQFLFTLLEIAPSRREILLTLIEVLAGEPNSETRC